MNPFRWKHISWYDIVVYLANTASEPDKPEKIYCWSIFSTPDNEDKPFDRNAFFDYLLMECGDFEVLFPNVEMLCTRLAAWSKSRLPYWQRIYDVLCLDYNPIWNYNRYDEDSTNTERNINVDSTQDILDKVAGYDSGSLVDADNQNAESIADEKYNEDWKRNNHSYGNIGVTTTQNMIKQEIEVAQFSMYDIMIQEFKETFCLAIYT